ncbi:type I-E CRISPR-associated protein Cse2/CasB [Deltaproteobacteria bacterium TL4]
MTHQEPSSGINSLIKAYQSLSNGDRSELRRLEDYREVPLLPVFYKVSRLYYTNSQEQWNLSEPVLSALLLFWRDRKANEESLRFIPKALGESLVGDPKAPKIKLSRFKHIMKAETLEEGFEALRSPLKMLRHEDLNWEELAQFLSALNSQKQDWINRCKQKLAKAYFEKYPLKD